MLVLIYKNNLDHLLKGRFQSGVVLSQVQIKEQMNGSRCSGRTEGRVSGLVKAEILAGRLIFMQIFTA